MSIAPRHFGAVLVAGLLATASAVMFLMGASTGTAATDTTTQQLQATVDTQIAWGTAPDDPTTPTNDACTQNLAVNDWGNLTPSPTASTLGTFGARPAASASTDSGGAKVWVACVTANATITSVTAQGTTDMTSGANTLGLSNVNLGITNNPGGAAPASCAVTADQAAAGTCALPAGGTTHTIGTNLPRGTNEFDLQYQLNLPANQAAGSYTGGVVTYTATA